MSSETILPPEGPEGQKSSYKRRQTYFCPNQQVRDGIQIHVYIMGRIVLLYLMYIWSMNDDLYVCIGAVAINDGYIYYKLRTS